MRFRRLCLPVCLALVLGQPGWAQDVLRESVASGTVSSGVLPLSLRDVVDRAIRNNLAALLGSEEEKETAAQRLQDLAAFFPKIEATVSAEDRQINLAAFGFTGFPGVRPIIGPFGLIDARAALTQTVMDLERRHNLRESTETLRASVLNNANTRELVVLTAVDMYFQVVSSQSRVTAVEAQLTRAKVLHDRAADLKSAGVAPGIDVLRAQVEQRNVEQRLIQARNAVEKQKLALARAIGLPLAQEFALSDRLPPEGETVPSREQLLSQAYSRRSDAMAAEARIRAAEEDVKSVKAKTMPTIHVMGDYGVLGPDLTSSHGTFSVRGEVRMPVFDRTISGQALEKEAILRQVQARRDSLRGNIELEVRTALLDVQSAEEQLRVARESLALAMQQLDQAQDRFSAGVANNLEVVQAQEASALADESVIESLYGFNIARALLARATGSAEQSIPQLFPGSPSR